MLAGGAESLSNVPLAVSKRAAETFMALAKARDPRPAAEVDRRGFRPRDFAPVPPAIAEYVHRHDHGGSVREDGEGERHLAPRAGRDRAAVASARRRRAGRRALRRTRWSTLFPPPRYDRAVAIDNGVRGRELDGGARGAATGRSTAATARSPPATRSPITDGGGAVLLMSETPGARPRPVAARLSSGRGPTPRPTRAGSCCRGRPTPRRSRSTAPGSASGRSTWSRCTRRSRPRCCRISRRSPVRASRATSSAGARPLGVVDLDRLNVNGGSLALGHPFGATGVRVTLQLLHELRRREPAVRPDHRLRRRRPRLRDGGREGMSLHRHDADRSASTAS